MREELIHHSVLILDRCFDTMRERMDNEAEYLRSRVMIFCEETTELIHTLTKSVRKVPISDIEEELADVAITIYGLTRKISLLQQMLKANDEDILPTKEYALVTAADCLSEAVFWLDTGNESAIPGIDFESGIWKPMASIIPRIAAYDLHAWVAAKSSRLEYRIKIKDE